METNVKIAIGNKIKALRENRGLTQALFSKGIGIKQAFLSLIESGERDLSLDLAKKIASFCDVDIKEVIGEYDITESNNTLSDVKEGYNLPDCRVVQAENAMLKTNLEGREVDIAYLKELLAKEAREKEMLHASLRQAEAQALVLAQIVANLTK